VLPFLRRAAVPWIGTAVVLVVGVVEFLLDEQGPGLPATAAVLALVALAGLVAPWSPLAAAVVVGVTFPVGSGLGLDGPNGAPLFALLLSTGYAGSTVSARRSWIAPAADQVLATLGILLWNGAPSQAWENLFFCLLLWASWGVGLLTRRAWQRAERLGRLAARLDAEREVAETTAVAAERARIARDVHDSVAHSVSVMVLQLGALRTTVSDERVATVLQGVERLGRQSVDELRGLVGVLREEQGVAAPPSLSRVPELLDEVRAAGLPVELEVHGEPRDLPQALDVSAYRVL
jgi:signal transduction histidine kinase